ncbi:MAG: hypothetical protein L6R36_002277 [Xanthoria steineri]|nr:MAG: hypothetical protein L6R36_002277 [Xanthoria steineri]
MHSKTFLTSAAFALCAVKVKSQDTANVEASDVEAVVPANVIDPAEATSLASIADGYIASVTAAPEFSSVVSVLATAIPITAQAEIAADPQGYLLDIIQGSPPPAWATALPPSVQDYVESLGQNAAQIVSSVTADYPELVTYASAQVSSLETATSIGSGFVAPTGGYGGSNYTNPRPTGSAAAPGSTAAPFVPGSGASTNVGGAAFAVMAASFGIGALFLL